MRNFDTNRYWVLYFDNLILHFICKHLFLQGCTDIPSKNLSVESTREEIACCVFLTPDGAAHHSIVTLQI